MNNQNTIIKLVIETLLDKMNIDGFVEINSNSDFSNFIIRTNEANLLIG